MTRLFHLLFVMAAGSIFLFGANLLDMVGWQYSSDAGPVFTRMHPGTYLIIAATGIAVLQFPQQVIKSLKSPIFIFYNVAAFILFIRGFMILSSGVTGGEITTVITNFFTPSLFYICARCLSSDDLRALEVPLRIFLAVNSLIGLAERLLGHRLIPGFLDKTNDVRSTGFLAHPLNASLVTGLVIVYLVTARRAQKPITWRLPELCLHSLAMFAFGGRSALVFTPIILVLSAIAARRERGQADVTKLQRALPIALIFVGISLVFLPIPFVDATIDRFTNDMKSTEQRNAALEIVQQVTPEELLTGINAVEREAYAKFHSGVAVELCWVALMLTYGLIAVFPMMFGLPLFLWRMSQTLDRSAFYMGMLFMIVTAGSLSIGVKSLLIPQCVLMMLFLSQRRYVARAGAMFQQYYKPGVQPPDPKRGA